jgi:voltage-gated potassium channel
MTRLARWERQLEWPLIAVAVVFLAGYALPILRPDLNPNVLAVCTAATWVAWAVFAVDYLVRLAIADDRWRFVRHNVLALLVIVLPLLRPLRLLRMVTLLEVLNRRAARSLHGHVAVYVTGAASLFIFCAALAILDAERASPAGNITTFGDALWWALTTVTTVGYGDHYPTTDAGKVIAAGLMIGGIALLGVVTATLASWFVHRVAESEQLTRVEVERLTEEVRQLRASLAERVER